MPAMTLLIDIDVCREIASLLSIEPYAVPSAGMVAPVEFALSMGQQEWPMNPAPAIPG